MKIFVLLCKGISPANSSSVISSWRVSLRQIRGSNIGAWAKIHPSNSAAFPPFMKIPQHQAENFILFRAFLFAVSKCGGEEEKNNSKSRQPARGVKNITPFTLLFCT